MKKIGLISLALVLALGALGVGFAAWTDTITISGTVTTGEVDWEIGTCSLLDDDEPVDPGGDADTTTPDYTCDDGFPWNEEKTNFYWELDKNVGWGEQEILANADGERHLMKVTLHNAYPSYFNSLSFYPRNTGTVPIKIDHVVIYGTMAGDVKVNKVGTLHRFDFNTDGLADFEIQWGDSFGNQLEPGGGSAEISFWMHVLQPCPQSMLDQLNFTIELVCVQWNEYPLP